MGIQEGCWDCPACEGTNRGSHIKCQGCGQTRGDDVEFYLPDDAADILPDNPLYAQATAGADWLCPYCDTSNLATENQCKACGGASRAEGDAREVKEVEDASKAALDAAEAPVHPGKTPEPPPAPGGGGGGLPIGKILLAGFACFFLFIFWLGGTSEAKMVVDRSEWTHTIQREKFGIYQEEDWRDQVPIHNSMLVSSEQKVRSHRQVYSHTENRTRKVTEKVKVGTERYKCGKINKGNGFFEDKYCTRDKFENRTRTETYPEKIYRKEPVYDEWVTYKIQKWKETDPLTASGTDHSPRWPEFSPTDTLRESNRNAKYVVWVKDPANDEVYEHEVKSEERFAKLAPGTEVVGVVTNAGHLKELRLPGEKAKS